MSVRVVAASASTNTAIYPSLVELTAAAVYADGASSTFVTIKTPTVSTINTAGVQNAMGDHSIEFEWLNQAGNPLGTPAKYTLTIRFGHEYCKSTSATPMSTTYKPNLPAPAASDPISLASHELYHSTAYTPALTQVDITPNFCKLLVSWSSATLDSSKVTVAVTEMYSDLTPVAFGITSIAST